MEFDELNFEEIPQGEQTKEVPKQREELKQRETMGQGVKLEKVLPLYLMLGSYVFLFFKFIFFLTVASAIPTIIFFALAFICAFGSIVLKLVVAKENNFDAISILTILAIFISFML